jgi:hypothetical protein
MQKVYTRHAIGHEEKQKIEIQDTGIALAIPQRHHPAMYSRKSKTGRIY